MNNISRPKITNKLSLTLVLVIPFILQIFAAVGLVGYLSFKNSQKAVNNLASQLQTEANKRIEQHLHEYLETSRKIAEVNADAFAQGLIDPLDLKQIGRYFWKFREVRDSKFGFLLFGSITGDHVSVGEHFDDGRITINQIDSRSSDRSFKVYEADKQGHQFKLLMTDPDYINQFQKEAWYAEAIKQKKSLWTSVYQWETAPYPLNIAASLPIYDRYQNLIGVMAIEKRLSNISNFLKDIKISPSAKTYIIERSGLIIATSTSEEGFTLKNNKPERLPVLKSRDLLIVNSANYLLQKLGNFQQIRNAQQLEFQTKDGLQFVQVTPWTDQWGIDWLVVIVVPEADFMGQIYANTIITIWLCLGGLILALALGIYTSRWIAGPILQLQKSSQAIASGELDQQIKVKGINELESLANSFNQMARQLRESFTALEKNNEELEQRVEERTAELTEAKKNADNANQAKSDFLANMSHELRTPLNGILGYAQILSRSKIVPEKERNGVNIIHQCGTHLLTLINDILDFSKIEARKLELTPKPLHFPSFLQGVVEICRVRSDQKRIDFIYHPESNLPTGIETDEKRLRQVLLNLLGNAIKFTDSGSVTLKIEVKEPNLDILIPRIKFQIEDSGVGIASDQIDKIFQAFEQVGEQKRQSEGTGLGLAISQRIVELMGGKIQVESEIGVGSNFYFEVALPSALDWVQQNSVSNGRTIIGYEGAPRHILIVDDRWENRSVLANLLEPMGFIITEAENGQEGLDKARQRLPDLMITDLVMPVMDGFEMLKQLRNAPDLKHLRAIVSSASVAEIDRQMSEAAGGDDFLAKPVDATELFALLALHLQLTWKYDAQIDVEPAVSHSQVSTVELIVPPLADLQLLLELAEDGLLKELVKTAEEIGAYDDRYWPFIQQIQQLAKQFQTEKIEVLIQKYLTNAEEQG